MTREQKKAKRMRMLSLMGMSNTWMNDERISKKVQNIAKELNQTKKGQKDPTERKPPKPTAIQQEIKKYIDKGYANKLVAEKVGCSPEWVSITRGYYESGVFDNASGHLEKH